MPDLTLYRADMEKIKFAIRVAQARWQRQGLMSLAQECEALGDLVNERLRQGLHPERPAQGEQPVFKVGERVELTQTMVALGFAQTGVVIQFSPAQTNQYLVAFDDGLRRWLHRFQIVERVG